MGETDDAMHYDPDAIFRHLYVFGCKVHEMELTRPLLGAFTSTRHRMRNNRECLSGLSMKRKSMRGLFPCISCLTRARC